MNRDRRKLEIARKLAAESLKGLTLVDEEKEEVKNLEEIRKERSAALIANLNEVQLYDIRNEGRLSSQFSFEDLESRLLSIFAHKSDRYRSSMFFESLMGELERAFLNCSVYIGLLEPGSRGELIRFVKASAGSRMEGRVLRKGQGLCFDVIESRRMLLIESVRGDAGEFRRESRSIVSLNKRCWKSEEGNFVTLHNNI